MSTENSQPVNEALGTAVSEDKSLVRIVDYSSPGELPKLDTKRSAAFMCDSEGKSCANTSKIPRPPLAASNSFNETLKSNTGKTKKAPSMIPRSKSRKRNENDKVKFDIPSKTECLKNQAKDNSLSSSKKSNCDLAERESGTFFPAEDGTPSKSCATEESGEQNPDSKPTRLFSSSLKATRQDLVDVKKERSDTSYKDAQEEIFPTFPADKATSKKERETNETLKSNKNVEDGEKDQREVAAQEKSIRNLYETIKCTAGPVFDNCKWIGPENTGAISDYESVPDTPGIQGHYEVTLKEISSIWKNTISLIGSVRDHAVKFVEESNKMVDKEQLILEGEMLQLALDFAISYSKLKTDFLIKLVRKRLNVKNLEKSELENFMETKTFAALYNNDDLAAMARTVQDLNTSLLRGEDLELE